MRIRVKITLTLGVVLLVLVTVGIYGVYLLKGVSDDALLVRDTSGRMVTTAYTTQVHFKKQVQEWKNVLLRGHEPSLLEKYWKQFNEEERDVLEGVQHLSSLLTENPSIKQTVDRFIDSHMQLSESYRDALISFKLVEEDPHIVVDLQVKGVDRAPTDLLDRVVEMVVRDRDSKLAILESREERVLLIISTATITFLIGAILFLLWLTDRKIAKPIAFATRIAQRISDGYLDNPIEVNSCDEIGRLLEALEKMQAQILESNQALQEKERDLRTITNDVADGILVIDSEQAVHFSNPAADALLNLENDGQSRPKINFSLLTEDTREIEFTDATSERKWLGKSVSEISWHSQKAFIVALRDITERKQAEEKLRQAAIVFENATEGVIITDADSAIVSINQAITGLTGYSEEEVLGKNPSLWKSDRHAPSFFQAMWASLEQTGQWRGEIWNRRKNGEAFPCWQTIRAVRDNTGEVMHYVSVLSDISAIKESQAKVEYLAHHDPLTDLPNRFLFDARLEHALERAHRTRQRTGVLFLDLDGFKHINDSLGHPAGDRVLQLTAERLRAQVREEDTVARLGGDEFTLLLEEITGPQEVAVVAQKLLESFKKPFELEGHTLHVTPSIGISLSPEDGKDVTTLVRNADTAMYRAKDKGRNTYQFYTKEFTDRASERIQMESKLHHALEQDEFLLYYQPQYSLQTGQLIGAEALVRWQHPDMGLVSPAKFIPLAEQTGLIVSIGEWVLATACTQIKEWRDQGLHLRCVSVNIAGKQLQRKDFFNKVQQITKGTGCSPEWLELEITEGFIMHQAEHAVRLLQMLRGIGIEVAIDDFGTGYSSLSYLKRLPLTKLKIDQSFIRDIPQNTDDMAIARAVIALGKSLQLKVIAEGVETEAQQSFLKSEGCDEVQGYLYSRPVPAEEFQFILNSHKQSKNVAANTEVDCT